MAYAIQFGAAAPGKRPALAFHVLDIMCALEESAASGQRIEIKSTLDQPQPLPAGMADGALDA